MKKLGILPYAILVGAIVAFFLIKGIAALVYAHGWIVLFSLLIILIAWLWWKYRPSLGGVPVWLKVLFWIGVVVLIICLITSRGGSNTANNTAGNSNNNPPAVADNEQVYEVPADGSLHEGWNHVHKGWFYKFDRSDTAKKFEFRSRDGVTQVILNSLDGSGDHYQIGKCNQTQQIITDSNNFQELSTYKLNIDVENGTDAVIKFVII